MILEALTDIQVVSLTIFGEMRGESRECQFACGNVIANRVRQRCQTWKEVCLASKQFSCWNPGDLNRAVLERVAAFNLYSHEAEVLIQCKAIAQGWIDKIWLDEVYEANHYYTGVRVPYWARNQTPVYVVGPIKLFRF